MESFNDVFKAVKEYCSQKIVKASFDLFIEPMEAGRLEGDTAVLYTNSEWSKGIIEDRFSSILKEGFEMVLGFTLVPRIEVKQPEDEVEKTPINGGEYAFTFDTFTVSSVISIFSILHTVIQLPYESLITSYSISFQPFNDSSTRICLE